MKLVGVLWSLTPRSLILCVMGCGARYAPPLLITLVKRQPISHVLMLISAEAVASPPPKKKIPLPPPPKPKEESKPVEVEIPTGSVASGGMEGAGKGGSPAGSDSATVAVDDEDEEWDAAMRRAAEANESDSAQFGLLDLTDAGLLHPDRIIVPVRLFLLGSANADSETHLWRDDPGPSSSQVESEEAPAISKINAPRCPISVLDFVAATDTCTER